MAITFAPRTLINDAIAHVRCEPTSPPCSTLMPLPNVINTITVEIAAQTIVTLPIPWTALDAVPSSGSMTPIRARAFQRQPRLLDMKFDNLAETLRPRHNVFCFQQYLLLKRFDLQRKGKEVHQQIVSQ